MHDLRFEWDTEKDKQNRRKHGVTCGEAESIFADDPAHSAEEDRFVLLGLGAKLRILVVVHAYREHRGVIRIISARKATQRERNIYNQRWRT